MNMKIPPVIMQTSKNKQPEYVIEMIKSKSVGWKYEHFTDVECIQFFRDNPIEEFSNIIKVFNGFTEGPHKGDLFRYYYLYIKGGVYIDSDAMIETNIEDIVKKYEFVSIVRDDKNLIFNGFLACTSNHQIMYDALSHIYKTPNPKYYMEFVSELYTIVKSSNESNIKLYIEKRPTPPFPNPWAVNSYDGENIILKHYPRTKMIPRD
tara:strand:- start:1443 stop:2063 length:621 start_codon:yes stop_codon:yes gene_type:complete